MSTVSKSQFHGPPIGIGRGSLVGAVDRGGELRTGRVIAVVAAAGGSEQIVVEGDRVRVHVLLLIGDEARVQTPWRGHDRPLSVPAARIAAEAGLPVSEVPGRWYTATAVGEDQLRDFVLEHDPRL